MTPKKWLAVSAIALLPFAAAAQNALPQPDPLDPDVSVQASTYQSAFLNYRTIGEETGAPDQAWRSANDEMGRLGGHAGHLKDEPAASPPSGAVGVAPAENVPAPSRKAPADHSKHH